MARLPEGTRCGIHGDPTESGRCASCDRDHLDDGPSFSPGHVLEAKTGGYLVLSRSTPGCWWLVHERSCSCPAGRSGRESCWHRRQVAAFVAKLNEAMKRPTAPPNISALVD